MEHVFDSKLHWNPSSLHSENKLLKKILIKLSKSKNVASTSMGNHHTWNNKGNYADGLKPVSYVCSSDPVSFNENVIIWRGMDGMQTRLLLDILNGFRLN